MGRCCSGGQENENSEVFSVVSLLGVAVLQPAPFAEHQTLLIVDKGDSVTGPLGGVFLPGHPGCPQRLRQEWVAFPEGRMSKLAEGKLARRLHGFSHRCPFSTIGLRGEIDV
jgi:hypothetical protein